MGDGLSDTGVGSRPMGSVGSPFDNRLELPFECGGGVGASGVNGMNVLG